MFVYVFVFMFVLCVFVKDNPFTSTYGVIILRKFVKNNLHMHKCAVLVLVKCVFVKTNFFTFVSGISPGPCVL